MKVACQTMLTVLYKQLAGSQKAPKGIWKARKQGTSEAMNNARDYHLVG